jgi:mannose-6-phosphate isomerase-like protein (cupin superfamily)
MPHRNFISRSLSATGRGSLLMLLALSCSSVSAQAPASEQSVTWTAEDSSIKWGPCPPFLPAGCGIAILHGDPSKDNVDVFLKVPGKSVLPSHWHSSAERMVLVAGEMHVTYEGQKMAVLRAGSYAYGPAKVPHKGVCASDAPCVLFIAFESPLDAVPAESASK